MAWQASFESVQEANMHLLTTGALSDVTFLVEPGNQQVKAHKFILSSRSPVFEVMFQRWDLQNSTVTITDTTASAFRHFLMFLYTNHFDIKVKDAGKVLHLAHKYDTKALARRCSDLMKTGIDLESAVGTYQVANLLDLADLKQYALDFLLKNATPILENISSEMELDTLSTLLRSNELCADELHVFQAVIKWAELLCCLKGIEPTAFNKRKFAAKLVPLIRFPVMKVQDFTNEIVTKNTGFLTEQECLQLLVYLTAGTTRARAAVPGLLFSTKVRIKPIQIPTKVVVYTAIVPEFDLIPPSRQRFIQINSISGSSSIMGFLTISVDSDVWLTSFRVELSRLAYPAGPGILVNYQNGIHEYSRVTPKLYISQNQTLPSNGHCFTASKQIMTWDDLNSVEFQPDMPMEFRSNQPYYFYEDENHLRKDFPRNLNKQSKVSIQDGKSIHFYFTRGQRQIIAQGSPKVLEISFTLSPS